MTERAPAATCGENPVLHATRLGCGERIETCAEVYRCTHCATPFHRHCAERHFAADRAHFNPAAIAYQVQLAQDRVGFNPDHHPKLQASFIIVAEKFLNRWREMFMSRDPLSAVGPLASLLADVVHETRSLVVNATPADRETKAQ